MRGEANRKDSHFAVGFQTSLGSSKSSKDTCSSSASLASCNQSLMVPMAAAEIFEELKAPKSLKSACQGAACKTSSLADETKLEKDSASSTSSEQNPESFSVLSGPDVVSSSAMSLGYPLNESSKDEQTLPSRDMEVLEYSGSSSSGSVDEMKKELDDCCTESNKESDSFGATMSLDKMQLESVFDDFDICLDGDGSLDLSDLDIDPSMLPELSTNSNDDLDLSAFYLEEVHEKDLAEEEALLLAEVSKVERKQEELKQLAQNSNCNSSSTNSTAMPVNAEYSTDSKRSSSDEAQKSSSKSPPQAKRKVKVDWTPDLHRRFVQAVEQLGVDKAVPSRILELMGVTCLTRHNIASHLQKYRSHRKHLLAREAEAATWNQRRQLYGTSGCKEARPWSSSINGRGPLIQPRPAAIGYPSVAAAAPGHSPAAYRPALLHVWGHPSPATAAAGDHSAFHMWHKRHCIPPATPSPWQSPRTSKDNWTHAAPGTPMFPQSLMRYPIPPFHGVPGSYIRPAYSGDLQAHIDATAKSYPSKEAVDAAISEVLSNPWTPLPIGLNPPSLDSVMAELQRQGVPQLPRASA